LIEKNKRDDGGTLRKKDAAIVPFVFVGRQIDKQGFCVVYITYSTGRRSGKVALRTDCVERKKGNQRKRQEMKRKSIDAQEPICYTVCMKLYQFLERGLNYEAGKRSKE
jgi:hypothetical protein